jgi:allophanate hydrolase
MRYPALALSLLADINRSGETKAAEIVADEIEIAVVGAHLTGMALNHELTSKGARFLRLVTTKPDYKLFALNGEPPKRPGLFRVSPGKGSAIETEIWSLAPDKFGLFVAAIPSPLGLGTLLMSDGSTPKGFIVESEGIDGAEDISRFGGWRAYIKSLG